MSELMIQKDKLVSETTLRRHVAWNMLKHITVGVSKWNKMGGEEGKERFYRILIAKNYVACYRHELGHPHGMYDNTIVGVTKPDASQVALHDA